MIIRPLDAADRGYALTAWQEAHKTSPSCARAPWWAYKKEYGAIFKQIVNDPSTVLLGAYDERGLLGFLVMTPGKRVHTLHWCQVKRKIGDERVRERRHIFFELVDAARFGARLVYTLRGPKLRKEAGAKSLDELLVAALRDRGISATHVPMKEWLK